MNPLTTPVYNGGSGTNTLVTRTLTPDGTDRYAITKSGGLLTALAPAGNLGSNLRRVAWPSGSPDLADTRVCATWNSHSVPSVQEGTAHRIRTVSSHTRAITLTKNVIYGVYWGFNVHTWDTSRSQVFEQVAQFDMADAVFGSDGAYRPLPWHVCTQVQDKELWFKLWFPAEMEETAWTDPIYARSAPIPADWTGAGKSGWYFGHLPPGGNAQYGNLGIWR
jgi:hypothetical protein